MGRNNLPYRKLLLGKYIGFDIDCKLVFRRRPRFRVIGLRDLQKRISIHGNSRKILVSFWMSSAKLRFDMFLERKRIRNRFAGLF